MSDSNLTVTSQDGKNLMALAESLGIEIDNDMSEVYQSAENQGTNYLAPRNIRRIYDAHKLGGVIQWTEADFKGKIDEREPESLYTIDENGSTQEITNITELRGIVVNYQQQDRLSYYDGEKTTTFCSVIGYTDPKTGEAIKKLPNTPYSKKYEFHQPNGKWELNTTKPDPILEKVGVIGNRGGRPTSCAECIKCGLSTETVTGQDGNEKVITCDVKGKLFMVVYEVVSKQKVKNPDAGSVKGAPKFLIEEQPIAIADTVDFDGEKIGDFILIEVPMSRSSIGGKYVRGADGKKDEEKSVDGYQSYVKGLIYSYKNPRDPRRNSVVHYTSLSFPKHPTAPTHMAHFRSLGVGTQDQIMDAVQYWQTETPDEDVSTLEVKSAEPIKDSASPLLDTTAVEMKQVEVIEDSVEESELPW